MSDKNSMAFYKIMVTNFQELMKFGEVFVADIDGDTLYDLYLASFPHGTDPIFKKKTEHDCSTCKNFIRRAGNVLNIDEQSGSLITTWGYAAARGPEPYRTVAERVRDVLREANVKDLFRVSSKEIGFGAVQTRSLEPGTNKVITWNHLHTGEIARQLRVHSPDAVKGEFRTTVQVFERGLIELKPDAVETVRGLINANALYRGEEHKKAVLEFQKLQKEYLKRTPKEKTTFAWANANSPASRFRNTVIGTLVQDLSEGQDIEHAVKSFETKVAPQNYKRTTALITPGMVKQAMQKIEELGLEPALERRFATIADISVNDVKWVDGAAKPLMKGGIGDLLMQHAASSRGTTVDAARIEDITLEDFVEKILPETTGLELFFKSTHVGNLMSLTAPVHPEPKQLFKWTNDFAWSYGGNVADSIKERVKKAGGKVEGAVLRVSLSWFNFDDLDLHIHQPPGQGLRGLEPVIFFRNKRGWTGGELDVDMNAGSGRTREPVENTVWLSKPPDGPYKVVVNNYAQRETSNPGFVVEMENAGKLSHFSYNKIVRNTQDIHVATLHVKNGLVDRVEAGDSGVTASNISQEKWGLKTEQYIKVSAVTLSPNYWGNNAVGNKHTFFVLEGAKNEEETRGFYNEFLHSRLEPHRKVFEVIGDKTKCQPADGQLSGLGFSSTKKESFIVRAQQGRKQRVFNVQVGA